MLQFIIRKHFRYKHVNNTFLLMHIICSYVATKVNKLHTVEYFKEVDTYLNCDESKIHQEFSSTHSRTVFYFKEVDTVIVNK